MADVTQDPSETTDDTQPAAQDAAPEALGPTGDVADAAPQSETQTPPESADSSKEAGETSDAAEDASSDGSEAGDAPADPTDAQTSPDALPAPVEITEPESADAAPEVTGDPSQPFVDGALPQEPEFTEGTTNGSTAPSDTSSSTSQSEGEDIANPTPEQPSAPTADGDQDTASAPEAPAELPPEEGGLMPDAPTAKAPEHDEVHPDGSDRADDAPMGVPAQDKNHRPTDGEPGDGPTHVGTDTPEFLVSNPCDPKTGRPLDGSGQPKGVIVGGSGGLNKAPDLTKTFGINNDQTMEEASAGLPEGYSDDEGDEPEGSDESSADSLDDGDDESTEDAPDKEALYQAIESKLNNVLEEIGEMLGL